MVRSDNLHCTVITPERRALDVDATFIAFPAHDGEMGILRDRAALLCKLGIGIMRVETATGTQRLFVDGGFAQMLDNRLTILTEQAQTVEEINLPGAQKALVEAQAMTITDEASFVAKDAAVKRAQTKIKLAS